ncbi:hypothetical protein G7K_3639-t1 [Saitoella complicata NRRL Y-17804]|uniref:Uncharacterized protein n=1 Tax=Saitoella complicata (strain BCRC 22490 / CBS 7301 / JCM 7358 / NBRC 10748 / NRRL Y-17804) TaxID=698492 RepID=A0A0E9NJB2_SAICN|nr:hypothetical protein G7K_3639-t1 [Saitoella complicata NRRL Y-17804]
MVIEVGSCCLFTFLWMSQISAVRTGACSAILFYLLGLSRLLYKKTRAWYTFVDLLFDMYGFFLLGLDVMFRLGHGHGLARRPRSLFCL